ncbi:TniQ family protein [Metapseudomonas resinovorans]|uniref:hypothetical protein n=1 Tax=Metapseudomonas resinovorans TaxID=53412 RepID=UPI0012DCAB24|nr:hypothetical protein [Pseudomonas resinovorans]
MVDYRLVKPVYDETFSSWVNRCLLARLSAKVTGLSVKSEFSREDSEYKFEDPDFDANSDYVKGSIIIVGAYRSYSFRFFEKEQRLVLPWEWRVNYCPECLRADVVAGRLPAWRKSWCYVMSVHCLSHNRQLSSLNGALSVNKAWDAFVYEARSEIFTTENYASAWMSNESERIRISLVRKVVAWYLGSGERNKISNEIDENLRHCFDVVLQMLLAAPTYALKPGAAWSLFFLGKPRFDRPKKGFAWALEEGMFRAGVHVRMSAVILAGMVFSIFSDVEVKFIDRLLKIASGVCRLNSYKIGSECFLLSNREDYLYVRAKFSGVSCSALERICEFVQGVEDSYQKSCEGNKKDRLWGRAKDSWRRWAYDPCNEPDPQSVILGLRYYKI